MSQKIAMIGVGNVGKRLGLRLASHGHEVLFGVRPGKDVSELIEQGGGKTQTQVQVQVQALSVADAVAAAEIVFLAVPAHAAVLSLAGLALDGKILVDCTNPLTWDAGPVWAPPPAGSIAAELAAAYPQARVVKAFNTFGAELHQDPVLQGGLSVDVPMAGDDAEAKEAVAELARTTGFTPIDAGPLRNAALLENMAMLWIHLALQGGHGREIGFKLLRRS